MNAILNGILRRYVLLLGLFLIFLIFVVNTQNEEGLLLNVIITFLALAAIPAMMYFLIKKKGTYSKKH